MTDRAISVGIRRRIPERFVNTYIYLRANWVLSLKKVKVRLHFWIDEDEIKQWFKNKNTFFILSTGRSGTKFLAELLNRSLDTLVVHEPFDENLPYQDAYFNPKSAEDYISKFRMREVYIRVHKLNINSYGEVNSYLRRHCKVLKKYIPNVKLLHLVRDGRDVVRSMYARTAMKPNAYSGGKIYPKDGDPWKSEWSRMSRFERLCWNWTIENKYLRSCISKVVRFEDIISDYEYFKSNILEYLNIDVPKDVWEAEVNRPRNITAVHKLPHWSEWSESMRESFRRICGDEMKIYGYELNERE